MTKQFKIAQDIVKLTISKAKYKEMQKDKKRLDFLDKNYETDINDSSSTMREKIDELMQRERNKNGCDL